MMVAVAAAEVAGVVAEAAVLEAMAEAAAAAGTGWCFIAP